MTGMTPERLDAIRANLPTPDADLSRRERDALDLLDEVKRLRHENADLRRSRDEHEGEVRRLRAGIESIARTAYATHQTMLVPDLLHALLNPTEGETDGPA